MSKLKDEPDKVARFLEMNDYFRAFIPLDVRIPADPDYDWMNDKNGIGYKMVNGSQVNTDFGLGLQPRLAVRPR